MGRHQYINEDDYEVNLKDFEPQPGIASFLILPYHEISSPSQRVNCHRLDLCGGKTCLWWRWLIFYSISFFPHFPPVRKHVTSKALVRTRPFQQSSKERPLHVPGKSDQDPQLSRIHANTTAPPILKTLTKPLLCAPCFNTCWMGTQAPCMKSSAMDSLLMRFVPPPTLPPPISSSWGCSIWLL